MTDMTSNSMEQTLLKVLEFQSGGNISRQDVLLTMSLLNLMGILDYLQTGRGEVTGSPKAGGGNDQMINMLLSMLANPGGGQGTGAGSPLAGQPFNPALLLPLLVSGRGGGQPDQAMLMGLLSSLMSKNPGPHPGAPARQESPRREPPRPTVTPGGGRKGEVLKWGGLPDQKSDPKV